jgi:hypothetical protein
MSTLLEFVYSEKHTFEMVMMRLCETYQRKENCGTGLQDSSSWYSPQGQRLSR